MHAITPIALTVLLLGAGCAALFGYCAYVFASVFRRPAPPRPRPRSSARVAHRSRRLSASRTSASTTLTPTMSASAWNAECMPSMNTSGRPST